MLTNKELQTNVPQFGKRSSCAAPKPKRSSPSPPTQALRPNAMPQPHATTAYLCRVNIKQR